MADENVSTPYSTASAFFGTNLPSWLNSYDAERLAAYKLYEDIYWTKPDTFKLMMRGTDDLPPIYLPSARIIINTMNRYVARGWQWTIDPAFGTDQEKALALQIFGDLFKRERFKSKFNSNRLYGLIRGDACWLIMADADKPEGSRLSIRTMDPGSYFPITDPGDDEKILGVDIIEQLVNGDDLYIKRQRYLKPGVTLEDGTENPSSEFIAYQLDAFELEDWEDPTKVKRYKGAESLPIAPIQGITKIPVYHVKNFEEPGNPFGSSEIRGIERLFAAVNQTVTDEDMALALQGLGLYWTDSGAPVDENGNDTFWNIGPGEVVEVGAGKKFNRLDGISSVDPSQKHMEFIQDQAFRVTGAGDVAQGRVDVQMAESGIALKLRMGPILDEASIKDDLLTEVMDQMLYDLREWLRVYEGENLDNTRIVSALGDKLPEDKAAKVKLLMDGYNSITPLWSGGYVRDELRKMGWEIPENELEAIALEQAAIAQMADEVGGRLDEEAGAEDQPEEE